MSNHLQQKRLRSNGLLISQLTGKLATQGLGDTLARTLLPLTAHSSRLAPHASSLRTFPPLTGSSNSRHPHCEATRNQRMPLIGRKREASSVSCAGGMCHDSEKQSVHNLSTSPVGHSTRSQSVQESRSQLGTCGHYTLLQSDSPQSGTQHSDSVFVAAHGSKSHVCGVCSRISTVEPCTCAGSTVP